MQLLGFDSRKNKYFWEVLGLALLIITMMIVSLLKLFHFDMTIEILQSIGFVFSLLFFLGIIFMLYKQYHIFDIRAKKVAAMFKIKRFIQEDPRTQRWNNIRKLFQSQHPSAWHMAIIDADAMLEDFVTSRGYYGATFGEKLKSVPANETWINDAWHVHKLRNRLAHEGSRYNLSEREAYQAFKIYENIFSRFGYIQ